MLDELTMASKRTDRRSKGKGKRVKDSNIKVEKSDADGRSYKAIVLQNGLECLLIEHEKKGDSKGSDDSAEQAAAALSVRVGSFSDPDDLPGLAHFCEHMVFMGNKKYPDEDGWEKFIADRGGDSNASTDSEATVFEFGIGPEHLSEALDRFAQFFIAPIFHAGSTKREVRAVNSEFKDSMTDDKIRRDEVMCRTAPDNHPVQRFGWGNLKSLEKDPVAKGIDVRAELLRFHKKFYVAEQMKLVVLGGNMAQMERDVRKYFAAVPSSETRSRQGSKREAVPKKTEQGKHKGQNKQTGAGADAREEQKHVVDHAKSFYPAPHEFVSVCQWCSPMAELDPAYTALQQTVRQRLSLGSNSERNASLSCPPSCPTRSAAVGFMFSHQGSVLDKSSMGKMFFTRSISNRSILRLSWSFPSLLPFYYSQPFEYLGYLIGHEGEGSILYYLRERGWSSSLCAGPCDPLCCSSADVFSVDIKLSRKGVRHIKDVIHVVFRYIAMLQRAGPQKQLWEEMKIISDFSFRFKDHDDPVDEVEEIADNMLLYPVEHALSGVDVMRTYNAPLYRKIVSLLTPDLCRFDVLAKLCEVAEEALNGDSSFSEQPSDIEDEEDDVTDDEDSRAGDDNGEDDDDGDDTESDDESAVSQDVHIEQEALEPGWHREEWFGAAYRRVDVPPKSLSTWASPWTGSFEPPASAEIADISGAETKETAPVPLRIHLPHPNKFLPQDFTIKATVATQVAEESKSAKAKSTTRAPSGDGEVSDLKLPAGWRESYNKATGQTFYINDETDETSWEPPRGTTTTPVSASGADVAAARGRRSSFALLVGTADTDVWLQMKSADGEVYYYNSDLQETRWDRPSGPGVLVKSVDQSEEDLPGSLKERREKEELTRRSVLTGPEPPSERQKKHKTKSWNVTVPYQTPPRCLAYYSHQGSATGAAGPSFEMSLWHKQDAYHLQPKTGGVLSFVSPVISQSVHSYASVVLMKSYLTSILAPLLYPAYLTEAHLLISVVPPSSLQIKVEAFSDIFFEVVKIVVQKLAELPACFNQRNFAAVKEQRVKQWQNADLSPFEHASHSRKMLLDASGLVSISREELRQTTADLTFADVLEVHRALPSCLALKVFIMGNVTEKETKAFGAELRSLIQWNPCPRSLLPSPRVVQLQPLEPVFLCLTGRSPQDTNSALHLYLQLGDSREPAWQVLGMKAPKGPQLEIRDGSNGVPTVKHVVKVIYHLMSEPCFDTLRTKEQLGYGVSCSWTHDSRNVIGLSVDIQSASHSAAVLHQRAELFLYNFRIALEDLSQEEYVTKIQGLLSELLYPHSSMMAEAEGIWRRIDDNSYNFLQIRQEARALANTSLGLVKAFFDAYVLPVDARSLRVQSKGKPSSNTGKAGRTGKARGKHTASVFARQIARPEEEVSLMADSDSDSDSESDSNSDSEHDGEYEEKKSVGKPGAHTRAKHDTENASDEDLLHNDAVIDAYTQYLQEHVAYVTRLLDFKQGKTDQAPQRPAGLRLPKRKYDTEDEAKRRSHSEKGNASQKPARRGPLSKGEMRKQYGILLRMKVNSRRRIISVQVSPQTGQLAWPKEKASLKQLDPTQAEPASAEQKGPARTLTKAPTGERVAFDKTSPVFLYTEEHIHAYKQSLPCFPVCSHEEPELEACPLLADRLNRAAKSESRDDRTAEREPASPWKKDSLHQDKA